MNVPLLSLSREGPGTAVALLSVSHGGSGAVAGAGHRWPWGDALTNRLLLRILGEMSLGLVNHTGSLEKNSYHYTAEYTTKGQVCVAHCQLPSQGNLAVLLLSR